MLSDTPPPVNEAPHPDIPDWVRSILRCPECGGIIDIDGDHDRLSCPNPDCGYHGAYRNGVLDLLPGHLDDFELAENDFRARGDQAVEKRFGHLPADAVDLVKFLDTVTGYEFGAQYRFFRNIFRRKWEPSGVGLEIGGAMGHQSGFIRLFYPETAMITSDVAPINMQKGRRLAAKLGFLTDAFLLADAEKLPFADESFDFIFSSGMLHHLGDLTAGLKSGYRVLKPGGKWFVVNELSIGSWARLYWNSRFGAKGQWARKVHIRENSYTLREWKTHFSDAGLILKDTYFHRVSRNKLKSWGRGAYYAFIAKLPLFMIRMGIPCEVNFVLEKPNKPDSA